MDEIPQQESQRQVRLTPVLILHVQHIYSNRALGQIHPDVEHGQRLSISRGRWY